MKIKAFFVLGILVLAARMQAATPTYTQQNPTSTQTGAFNVQGGTITTKLSLPFLNPNTLVQTDANGNLTTLTPNPTFYIQNTATLQSGATAYPSYLYVGSSGTIPNLAVSTLTFSPTSNGILGVTDGSVANPADVGYTSSTFSGAAYLSFQPSGNYGDLNSLSIPAGDWLTTACIDLNVNGASITNAIFGISPNPGNSGVGLTTGDNALAISTGTLTMDGSGCVANYHVNISAATTYYEKYQATFSGATPQARGRFSILRIR